jgi:GAF domain
MEEKAGSVSPPGFGVIAARIGAILVLCLIPFVWAQIPWHMHQPAVVVQAEGGRDTVAAVNGPEAARAGVRVGDVVDVTGLNGGDAYLLALGSVHRPVTYRIVRGGTVRPVTLRDVRVPWPSAWYSALDDVALGVVGTITLVVAAILLWRRPSVLTAAFAVYAFGAVPIYTAIELFTGGSTALLGAIVTVGFVLFGPVPQFALLCFAVRFPRVPASRLGRAVMHAADALLVAAIVFYAFRYGRVDAAISPSELAKDLLPQLGATVLASIVAAVRFSRSIGADRRRVGWVLLGMILSGIGYCTYNFDRDFVNIGFALPHWIGPIAVAAYGVLPLALIYAVLRHRVIDVGFALNRTVVYSIITLMVVVVVSAVDWLSGRFFSNSNLSVAIEGAITIAFGVALNWIHGRVERLVDRVVFRSRHLAATRLELRIRALDYATAGATVEEALVDDVVDVLRVRSAAVFRRTESRAFVRVRQIGWDGERTSLDPDHLLVRALLAEERTVYLGEQQIDDPAFPRGAARPDIAIPLVVRHDVIGLALYGHRDGEGILDPEERALLERLVRAGASAYDAIEAAEWRRLALLAREAVSANAS